MKLNSQPRKRTTSWLIVLLIAVSIVVAFMTGFWLGGYYPHAPARAFDLAATSFLGAENVEAYWDVDLENAVRRIDWGDVLKTSNNITFHLRNILDVGIMPSLNTTNWEPYEISQYTNLEWNYDGSVIYPNETRQVTLTLNIPNSNSFANYVYGNEVNNCTFKILIKPAVTFCNLVISEEMVNEDILPQKVHNYSSSFLYRDTAYERVARQDASIVYKYTPTDSSKSLVYVMINVADSLAKLLIDWNDTFFEILAESDIQLLEDVPIIAHSLVLNATGTSFDYIQTSIHWYVKALYSTETTVQERFVKATVMIISADQENYFEFQETLYLIAEMIAAHWVFYD